MKENPTMDWELHTVLAQSSKNVYGPSNVNV